METVEITENNLESFLPILGEDLSDDTKRLFFRGIGLTDENGNALGAMVLELLHGDNDEEDKGSRICFLNSGSKEGFDAINSFYRNNTVVEEEIRESTYELPEERETEALTRVGFSCEKKESATIVLTLGELSNSKFARAKTPKHIKSIEQLTILQYRTAIKRILFKGHKGILDDIAYLPLNWFDSRISSCVISDNHAAGLFLIRRTPTGVLIPVLYCAFGSNSRKNLIYMLRHSLKKALLYYPPETQVMIIRKNKHIRALADKLFPGHRGMEVFSGMRKE